MIDQSITLAGKAGHEIAASVDGPELGLPVILAHGGGQTRRAWRAVAHRLASHGFRTIAVDMRGHGESAWASDGAYDISDFAADLVEIAAATSSEARRVGTGCVWTCRSRWAPYHLKNKTIQITTK